MPIQPRHCFPYIAALALAALLFGCSPSKRVGAAAVAGDLPDQETSDFVLTETDKGHPVWTLYARSAAMFNARNEIVGHGVRVDFFDSKGVRSSQLTAREGLVMQQTRDMIARGNVVMKTAEGTRMTTEELRFLNSSNRIVSDKRVRVEKNGDVLMGIGFESDPELRRFEFKTKIEATIRTRSGALLESRTPSQDKR
ncbi:MAG: LPS export ABC transporter periplasmic protein LptC [Candidatus Eisenbacteria bacterium]